MRKTATYSQPTALRKTATFLINHLYATEAGAFCDENTGPDYTIGWQPEPDYDLIYPRIARTLQPAEVTP